MTRILSLALLVALLAACDASVRSDTSTEDNGKPKAPPAGQTQESGVTQAAGEGQEPVRGQPEVVDAPITERNEPEGPTPPPLGGAPVPPPVTHRADQDATSHDHDHGDHAHDHDETPADPGPLGPLPKLPQLSGDAAKDRQAVVASILEVKKALDVATQELNRISPKDKTGEVKGSAPLAKRAKDCTKLLEQLQELLGKIDG